MSSVSVSSKGQVVIPKNVRERLGIRTGSRLELTEAAGELRLRPERLPGKTATVAEGRGLAGYKGPRISIEEMNRAVREAAATEDERIRDSWNRSAGRKHRRG